MAELCLLALMMISYAIFDDRLVVWNNGTLPSALKIGDLKKPHESYPRNKKIVGVFKSRGWIEKSGTGTLRMIEECRKLGVHIPKFEEYSGGFAVTFKFKESMGISISKKPIVKAELSPRQKAILEIIDKRGSASIQEIIEELENPPTQRMIRNDLNELRILKLIDLKGYTHKASWVSSKK